MANACYSKSEAIKFGWETMKKNLGFFIGLLLVAGIIYIVPGVLAELLRKTAPVLSALIRVASGLINLLMIMGVTRVVLKLSSDEETEFFDLFSAYPLYLKYFGGSILYGLIVFAGLLLLIVPGIIWAIKYQFFGYFILDKEMGPIEALKQSASITAGAKGDLFLLGLLLSCINVLGVLCLFVGLFATIPATMLAKAFVYRALQPRPQGEILMQEAVH